MYSYKNLVFIKCAILGKFFAHLASETLENRAFQRPFPKRENREILICKFKNPPLFLINILLEKGGGRKIKGREFVIEIA